MRIKKRPIGTLTLAAVILIGTIGAAALYWRLESVKSIENPEGKSNDEIWTAVLCRAQLYWQKAKFELPEVSWTELWGLTLPGRGLDCDEGGGLNAIQFTAVATEDDRKSGARIFHERCSGCHGIDGSGGPFAPSLTRSQYNHGDSDLAIYEVLRDGIPGTAMQSAGLTLLERLQVTSHLRALQNQQLSRDGDPEASRLAIQVSNERLLAAGSNPDEWLMYSGSYNGWRHAPSAEITPANVTHLDMRWVKQFNIENSNIEATPLVIDGTIFTTADPGHIFAVDAKTGTTIWEYKRTIPPRLPIEFPVNRGLAVQGSTLFFGSLDGYLVAINADDGKVIWQTLVASPTDGYSITAAPLVVNRSVVIGITGGEFGVRGFLAAYDVSSGQQQWKFNTIPGPDEAGHETWENDAWKSGGGGTWITGSYDPSSDLLYWGVGNPSPGFSGDVRPGDNLYTASVIALHATTGKLAWYFQFTPHDEQDRDSAQTPVLADLRIKGAVRKVICWPNRNGFYYVLDRVTGDFLAGTPFVEVTWAKGLTPTGRPILSNVAQVSAEGRRISPGVDGGTNWQNPAFDPSREFIFIPSTEGSSVFTKLPSDRVTRGANGFYVGSGASQGDPSTRNVLALDAATGARKWEYGAPSNAGFGNGRSGLLSTEGGLVFGGSGGVVFALDADTGRELWRRSLGGSTKSSPISFTVDGRQVVVVAAGRALFEFGL